MEARLSALVVACLAGRGREASILNPCTVEPRLHHAATKQVIPSPGSISSACALSSCRVGITLCTVTITPCEHLLQSRRNPSVIPSPRLAGPCTQTIGLFGALSPRPLDPPRPLPFCVTLASPCSQSLYIIVCAEARNVDHSTSGIFRRV